MRVSELTDHKQINALVAMIAIPDLDWFMLNGKVNVELNQGKHYTYCPTQGNQQTYELIEKFDLTIGRAHDDYSFAEWGMYSHQRVTEKALALAICKAVIASKWGDTIPDDVMEQVR